MNESDKVKFKMKKIALLALKIGFGGSLAYYLAQLLDLEYASSAGTICLLTLQTTKWETLKLSTRRLFTFFLTFGTCMLLSVLIPVSWFDYGMFLFSLVFFCETMGWRSAISVNAVTAAHLLAERDFSYEFMMNELLLVIIGVTIAILLNLFHINKHHETLMIKNMRWVEERMQLILKEMAGYLRNQSMGKEVWKDIADLRKDLFRFVDEAQEYQNNTFVSHPEYYINYFEMRKTQCLVLHNLHSEMRRLRNLPKQAETVADYMDHLSEYIHEHNDPQTLINQLEQILKDMKAQPLPESREEFESRAMLYHVLMDMEDFLILKRRFISNVDEKQKKIYWKGKE